MEKKLSAMQELIEHMEYFKDYSAFARDSIKKATELLAKEKDQIVDAYVEGSGELLKTEHGEEYFNQTYKQ